MGLPEVVAHHDRPCRAEQVGRVHRVAERLRHLLAIHIDQAVVHPVPSEGITGRGRLGELVLVVRESQVEPTAVDVERVARRLTGTRFAGTGSEHIPDAFAAAMDDDLSVPQALAVLHDTIRQGNASIDGENLALAAAAQGQVMAMTEVLGINPFSAEWSRGQDKAASGVLNNLVDQLLDERQKARAARDFAAADRIRDALTAAGITIEDTSTGAHWSIDGQ